MRVAVYYSNTDIRIEERERPEAGPGEALVKIFASGICGSDLLEWYRLPKAPIVLGHEVAGEVVAVGSGVTNIKPGDRVSAAHHVPCNSCELCRTDRHSLCDTLRSTNFDPGGFSEYVRLPVINVQTGTFLLPDGLSYEEATFAEPLACVVRAQRLAGVRAGSSVLVLGSGLAGLMHIRLARNSGASRILATDISEFRTRAALRSGADATCDGSADVASFVKKELEGRGVDFVFVCAGSTKVIQQALDASERGGSVCIFALPTPGEEFVLNLHEFWKRGITLTSSYAGPPADTRTAIDLLADGSIRVKDLVTHTLPLDKTAEGFALAAAGGSTLKVIIKPNE